MNRNIDATSEVNQEIDLQSFHWSHTLDKGNQTLDLEIIDALYEIPQAYAI